MLIPLRIFAHGQKNEPLLLSWKGLVPLMSEKIVLLLEMFIQTHAIGGVFPPSPSPSPS